MGLSLFFLPNFCRGYVYSRLQSTYNLSSQFTIVIVAIYGMTWQKKDHRTPYIRRYIKGTNYQKDEALLKPDLSIQLNISIKISIKLQDHIICISIQIKNGGNIYGSNGKCYNTYLGCETSGLFFHFSLLFSKKSTLQLLRL